jgi:hypothetical protein
VTYDIRSRRNMHLWLGTVSVECEVTTWYPCENFGLMAITNVLLASGTKIDHKHIE